MISFTTGEDDDVFAACLEAESGDKTCFGVQRILANFNKYSWYFPYSIQLISDQFAVDSPNLMQQDPLETKFPGLFGDWIIYDPIIGSSITTVRANRMLPKYNPDGYYNDYRFMSYEEAKVWTYT